MNTPKWTNAIRQGDFAQAEEELSRVAAQRIIPEIQQQYWQGQVNSAAQRINAANPYSKYVAGQAMERVQQEMAAGKVHTPEDLIATYEDALNAETENFRREVRPGYMRSETEPFLPADQEVRDYVASRRAGQEQLKEEGRRLPNNMGGR